MGNQQPINGGGGGGAGTGPGHGPGPGPGGAGGNAGGQGGGMPPGSYGYGMPPSGTAPEGFNTREPTQLQQQQQQQQQQQHAQASSQGTDENLKRSGSDASMHMLDAEQTAAAVAGSSADTGTGTGTGTGTYNRPEIENWLDDDTVPTVFRWEHGGRQVYITGTFNGWSRQIPMHRSGNDFTYIHNLKRGKHAFKFIVDDEWRFAPDQPTVADIEGRINNFIDVTDFKAYTGDREFEREKAAAEYGYSSPPGTTNDDSSDDGMGAGRPDQDGEIFSHTMPDLDDYTKEPPPLPPHLRHIILNKPPQLQDTAALPVPQHVALNHLYCTAIKDNMMVLGITQRYKTKFVTTVYYSPCSK